MLNIKRRVRLFIDLVFAAGWGITLHAVANEMYYKGGHSEILSPQGEYVGLLLILVAYLALRLKEVKNRE